MLFTAIDHPAFACRDVERQIAWYCKHLGMQLVASNGQSPPSVVLGFDNSIKSGAMVELMPAREPGPPPAEVLRFSQGLRHVALRVTNFDEAFQQLKAAGIEFLSEPLNAVGGGRIVSFRDPEGNELQIVER